MKISRNGAPMRRIVLAVVVLGAGMVGAQAQQKRLGFVVGVSEYGSTDHPTALQDAGLVSQSLKGAGFEVIEGANLSQSEFRAAFRDFTQKAAAAGPDAILAFYVSGVSLQEDGENILLPGGANIRQRADLALEGLRAQDFIRALGATPARARLVMVDTAYLHPYGQIVAEGARGLALTEALPGMIVAYNTAPGLAGPLPQSNYGPYAMALAEALREPGLNLNGVFERVRLRTHELSAGAMTPWNAGTVPADVLLNAPAEGAPAVPPPAAEMERPLAQLGADDAYARALSLDTIRGYQDFLTAYPDHAQAKRVRALLAARREALFWQKTRRANSDRAYWTYLKRYPRGAHAAQAESMLTRLSAPVEPPPAFEEVVYEDVPPPPPEELVVFDSVVADDGWDVLPPPPAAYPAWLLPPPPVAIIDLPPPPPPSPLMRALPVIGLGVGAAVLANRMWKRPERVRQVVAPPVPRPMRPPGGWGNRQPVVLPPNPRVMPQRPGAIANPPVGVRPGGLPQPGPGVVNPGRPGGLPQPGPGVVNPGRPGGLPQPGVGQPGMGRPGMGQPGAGQPGVVNPGGPGKVMPPANPAPIGKMPPPVNAMPPGKAPPVVVPPPVKAGPPAGVGAPVARPPMVRQAPPPVVRQAPVARPPMVRQAPVARPPMVRQAPVARPPMVRQAPPAYRPPAPAYRPPAPAYRPPAPAYRAPAPAYRPPAPAFRPPPAARPMPAAPSCTPQLRALRRC